MLAMYTGGAATIASLLEVSIQTAVWIIGAATILNVTLGGIRGVGHANLIHASFKYMGLIVVALVGWGLLQTKPQAIEMIPKSHFSPTGVGVSTLIAWTLANIGAVFSTQYVIQCIGSLSTPEDAKKASIVASITIVPIGLFAAFIGIASRGLFPDIKSVMAMPVFFNVMNPWLAGIAVSGIIAATFVTILACQLGATALIMKDFYIPFVEPDEKQQNLGDPSDLGSNRTCPNSFCFVRPGIAKDYILCKGPPNRNRCAGYLHVLSSHCGNKQGSFGRSDLQCYRDDALLYSGKSLGNR